MICGYARVSTDGQSVAAQVAQLTAAGAEKVFREVASGAKTDRAQLALALALLDAGDVLGHHQVLRGARPERAVGQVIAGPPTASLSLYPHNSSCSPECAARRETPVIAITAQIELAFGRAPARPSRAKSPRGFLNG